MKNMKLLKGINMSQHGFKPKKAMTPYIAYVSKMRKPLTEEIPGISFPDAMKTLGERWANLSETDKQEYVELSDKDK